MHNFLVMSIGQKYIQINILLMICTYAYTSKDAAIFDTPLIRI